MTNEERNLALKWIRLSFVPAKNFNSQWCHNPYSIKHRFEDLTDIYMTEEEMTELLEESGFESNGSFFKIKSTAFYATSRKMSGLDYSSKKREQLKKMLLEKLAKDEKTERPFIRFTAHVDPLPGKGRKNSKEYMETLGTVAKTAMHGNKPLSGILKIWIKIYRAANIFSRSFGDIDNHQKAIFDALNGICFEDDRQIYRTVVEKFQDVENPRIEIEIEEVG